MKNTLYVLVKKYYDKTYGNTYHSVQTEINDNILHSGITYGYERQYEQTFIKMIEENQKEHEERLKAEEERLRLEAMSRPNPKEKTIASVKVDEVEPTPESYTPLGVMAAIVIGVILLLRRKA